MNFTLEEIDRIFSTRPTPETAKDVMNSLLVDYNGFTNIEKTGYMMTYFQGEDEDYYPFTLAEPPPRFRSPPRDDVSLKSEYGRLASKGLEPKYIIIKTVHKKGPDSVETFIDSGTFRDFCNVNYRIPSVNKSVRVVSTRAFGKVSNLMPLSGIQKTFKEKAEENKTTPLTEAFDKNYACILPSGKLQVSPMQILRATREISLEPIQNSLASWQW